LNLDLLGLIKKFGPSRSVKPPLRHRDPDFRADPQRLYGHVKALTSTSKPRNYTHPEALDQAARYIQSYWKAYDYEVSFQTFEAAGRTYSNVVTSIGPTASRSHPARLVVGAHYDVAGLQPGADDNASGVAGLLELSRLLRSRNPPLERRIDLVAYCLEEPPFFATSEMGSAAHARSLREYGVEVDLMISLEMIGYFTEEENSQDFPIAALRKIYPTTGNFIGVVGDLTSVRLVKKVKALMKSSSLIDVHSINAPTSVPGVGFSDHRSYWDLGYPAIMLTDTAFFRNPNYHMVSDTIGTLNFEKMSEVVEGVYGVVTGF
jgi:Zn-dependent M28 family amino/carboxypeptidase